MLTEAVEHIRLGRYDIFGRPYHGPGTSHLARLSYADRERSSAAAPEPSNATAVVMWLIDHPRQIAMGDLFKLPDGALMKVAGVERRAQGTAVLWKVTLHDR